MFIQADTLDDALATLYPTLKRAPEVVASRGKTRELVAVNIVIREARARLSRSETRGRAFSALGELLWYLSRRNDLSFIETYIPHYKKESEDGSTVFGGYGPRLFDQRGCDQIDNVIKNLRERPSTRKAVVQIFNAEDIAAPHREIPCTTTLQFMNRDDGLHLITTMRSNDAYWGLPHDVFCFTMLQEIVARSVGAEVGAYHHFVGSLHLYDKFYQAADDYVSEAYQARVQMPEMPRGDPWPALGVVTDAESRIRRGESLDAGGLGLAPYWEDLVRLIQIFHAKDVTVVDALRKQLHFQKFAMYAGRRGS